MNAATIAFVVSLSAVYLGTLLGVMYFSTAHIMQRFDQLERRDDQMSARLDGFGRRLDGLSDRLTQVQLEVAGLRADLQLHIAGHSH
jgi:hypothetical protein